MYMVIQFNPENDVVELKELLEQGKFRYLEASNLQDLYEKYKAIREQAKKEATAAVKTDKQKLISEKKIDNQAMDSENSENSKFKIPKNPSESQESEKVYPIAHTQKLLAALGPQISKFSEKRTMDILREKIGNYTMLAQNIEFRVQNSQLLNRRAVPTHERWFRHMRVVGPVLELEYKGKRLLRFIGHMSIHSIRRQVKNVALKYSEAQVKVRNATSNSPGGPSAYQMEEIAILTQNPVCYMEIMAIIWQRLNDSGKNWRHVDKSLTLLEYLIRRGHSQVIEMSRQNLYMIETLKDFEYEENRQDRGFDIRQKALNIASVLTDLENLKKKNRESSGMERNGQRMEMVREYPDGLLPSDMIEEDMQLQLALALSREQCEKELEMSKSDEVRLQMAMENLKKSQPTIAHVDPPTLCSSSNLLGGLSDPWAVCSSATATSSTDVLMMNSGFETNFLEIPKMEIPKLGDFWNPPAPPALIEPPRSLNLIGDFMSTSPAKTPICTSSTITNNFLGENGKLVNLDDLMGTGSATSSSGNPWSSSSHHISALPPVPVNPFAPQRKMPTLNEMRAAQSPAHFTTNQSIDNRSIDPFAGLFF